MALPKILIVEDEYIIAENLQKSLDKMGYNIFSTVSSGKEALKKINDEKPDLVLMDIVLKGEMNGIETTDRIKSRFKIPVIYISSYVDDKILERAKITEPYGYIIKPFEERELYITIKMALYKHKMEDKLSRAHDELEKEVNKRTADLAKTNEQLIRQIKEREQADMKIKAALKEKEVLLKEIHHRVKNNLQIISSLLDIQVEHIKDNKVREILKESQNRVMSIALIHQKLYQAKDLVKINFEEYVRDLVNSLFCSYMIDQSAISLQLNIDLFLEDIDTVIPLALIINEVVSNSLKHAFPEGKNGEICIELFAEKNNKFTLVIADNGVGFPADIDFRHTKSLGLQLVMLLVEQLKGNIELDLSCGTKFIIWI